MFYCFVYLLATKSPTMCVFTGRKTGDGEKVSKEKIFARQESYKLLLFCSQSQSIVRVFVLDPFVSSVRL